jgi:hypothetical protein
MDRQVALLGQNRANCWSCFGKCITRDLCPSSYSPFILEVPNRIRLRLRQLCFIARKILLVPIQSQDLTCLARQGP